MRIDPNRSILDTEIGFTICYCCGKFETSNIIDIISISAKIGMICGLQGLARTLAFGILPERFD
jgi:hypothetical protein